MNRDLLSRDSDTAKKALVLLDQKLANIRHTVPGPASAVLRIVRSGWGWATVMLPARNITRAPSG